MKKYIAPRVSSTEVRAVSFEIQGSPELIAIIRGLLLDLTNPNNWEPIETITITPAEAAQLAELTLESFESGL